MCASEAHGLLTTRMFRGGKRVEMSYAKDLQAGDWNGFSDPYCAVRVNDGHKQRTHVVYKTLNPLWSVD